MSTKGIASAFTQAVAGRGDRPITAGMARWEAAGRPIERWAVGRVHEIMIADIGGRADGSGRIRPSSIGNECVRLQMLSYLGYAKADYSDQSLELMDAGTWAHYKWQVRGLSAGFLTEAEPPVGDPSWRMAGSMDGNVIDGSIFELKNTAAHIYSRILKDDTPKWEHKMQVGAYMKARKVEKASIVYENRAEPWRWHEFRITMTPDLDFALGLLRKKVVTSINDQVLPEMHEDCHAIDSNRFNGCEYRDVCPSAKWREAKFDG